MDDHELLRDYVRNRSQDAFRELVDRHLGMVYSAAHRMVGDAHLAEEVAQNVFATLARKAETLSPPQVVGGWLYNTARHLSMHSVRAEQRRREREQIAAAMQSLETHSDPERIADQLEPAMAELEAGERDVLVLRYLENRSLREVGAELGISEDAARMRANRALEQLRTVLQRQGVGISSVLLASALAGSTVSAVPAGLTTAIMATAVASTAAVVATTTHTVIATMNWINMKSIAAIVAALAVAGTGTYLVQQKQVNQLRADQEALQAEQTKLRADRDAAVASADAAKAALERSHQDTTDLLRLRREVGTLRQQLAAAERQAARASTSSASGSRTPAPRLGEFVAKAQFAHRGYATPEDALQTVAWATMSGTSQDQVFEGLSPELVEDAGALQQFQNNAKEAATMMKGIQIMARKVLSDDRVEIKVKVHTIVDGAVGVSIVPMTRIGGGWKVANGIHGHSPAWDNEGQIQVFAQ